jgi:hypothetical protein
MEMKMKVSFFVLMCCTVFLAGTAHAEFKGCYERVYEKSYLKKHRKQDVIKIRLQLGAGKGDDGSFELRDRIDAGFRKRSIYHGNLIECKPLEDELSCNIESDGGTFIVTDRGERSVRITNTSFLRFGDGENSTTLKAKGEHKEFKLYRISEGSCP